MDEMAHDMKLPEYLASTPLSVLLSRQQRVLTLEHNQTIGEALKALAKRKVLSAPLVISPALEDLSTGETPFGPTLLGWIDVSDVLRGLISHLQEKHKTLPSNMLQLMSELETEGKSFSRKPLITLTGSSDRRLVYTGEASATLMQTIREQFLGGGGNAALVHRLAVFDDDGTVTNIVSQLDVVRHLSQHSEQLLGAAGGRSLTDLGLPFTRSLFVSVEPSMPTLLAFDHMLRCGVSGAPVLTAQGVMVANLSVSDLRCIQPEHLGVLALPVAEFLALLHRTTYLGYSQVTSASKDHAFFAGSPRPRTWVGVGDTAPPSHRDMARSGSSGPGTDEDVRLISVLPTSTLNEVLHMLGDNHIHRVYVLDPEPEAARAGTQLKGIITPTDILCWAAGVPAPARVPASPKTNSRPLHAPTFQSVQC